MCPLGQPENILQYLIQHPKTSAFVYCDNKLKYLVNDVCLLNKPSCLKMNTPFLPPYLPYLSPYPLHTARQTAMHVVIHTVIHTVYLMLIDCKEGHEEDHGEGHRGDYGGDMLRPAKPN